MRPARTLVFTGVTIASISLITACGGDGDGSGGGAAGGAIAVTATDTTCEVAKTTLTAGTVTFRVTNKGGRATEFEVLRADGRILSERENIGPGTTADLTVQLAAGSYKALCSPGMTRKGPTQDLKVTGQGAAQKDPRLDKAVADYRAYIDAQVADTIEKSKKFIAAVKAGDIEEAKRLYAPSRFGWESIEPVAESFGDIDPKVDLREADLEKGQQWTGWHRLEKALWKTRSVTGETQYADRLMTDLLDLQKRVGTADITPTSMANGAKELLDEVATGKVTGEEEAFSHTDLVDFKANVDGAQKVYELLKPVVQEKDATLASTLDQEFADVQAALKKYQRGDGYVSYDTVGESERKQLAEAVDALGEPLSKLAGAVAK